MFNEADNVILSGNSGFLGSVVFKRLHTLCTFIKVGRKDCDIRADLSVEVPDLGRLKKVDYIIHAAGRAHVVPKTTKDKEELWKVNLEGTKNLCRGVENSGSLPTNFIFISTVSVYGLDEGENIEEKHSLEGTSDYAQSKIAAEQWLIEWAKSKGIKLLILRLPLIAGPNPPGNLGDMIQGIKAGCYFRIGAGNARRSMVLAADVADIIARSKGKEGIYNLTDGYHPSFNELERLIASQLGRKPPRSIPLPLAKMVARSGDILGDRFPINSYRLSKITSSLTFNDDKARHDLGWDPHRVLDEFKIH